MPGRIYPDGADPRSYRGIDSIFEYLNADGRFRNVNCGQAAICTFLTHYRVLPSELPFEQARETMRSVESQHPPDYFGGWLGTTRRRVERACRSFGIPVEPVNGEPDLRKHLDDLQPVMVMCAVEGPRIIREWYAPSGHWMVAYGYDESQLFLTNWSAPSMQWAEFRRRWGAFVPKLLSLQNIGIAAVTQLVDRPDLDRGSDQSSAIA